MSGNCTFDVLHQAYFISWCAIFLKHFVGYAKIQTVKGGIAMENFSAKKTFLDIRNFLAGRFMGATRDEFFLEELVKIIFCKYMLGGKETTSIEDLSLASLYRETFKKVLKQHDDIYPNSLVEIELDPVSIKYIDNKLNGLDMNNLERDIIGDAYEIFIGDAIKGQSGQFFTPQNAADALVRIVAPKTSDRILDLACGAGGFLVAALKYWRKQGYASSSNYLFGVDKDSTLTRLAKIHLACMGQPTDHIKCADSLVWDERLLGQRDNEYDIILTNPPFGVNIQAGSKETLATFKLGYKYRLRSGHIVKTDTVNESVAPQVVFLEQCVNLVKEGGYIGIVVPESMISNKKYAYVTNFILTTCLVKAVIGMPEELFKTSGKGGTHTKTCLLVLQKKNKDIRLRTGYHIFMAEAKWCGHDSRGRLIPKDDIPEILDNYGAFMKGENSLDSSLGFSITNDLIVDNVLAPRAYAFNVCADKSLASTHTLVSIGQLVSEGVLQIATGNEVGKLAYGTGDIPFVRTSDISNWEIKADPKHLVSEKIYDELASKQDVQEGDILMVKDGSYLIGTCAMVTKYDTKIVYQSHLYKIRVTLHNQYCLDNYYLLALLSSKFVQQQIMAKTYSQDIINSLGDRLKDIVIPISLDAMKIKRIGAMVKLSIDESIEARELAKRVRMEVLEI